MKLLWPIKNLVSYKIFQIYDKLPYISQGFGENPQIYAPFGLNGHNGIDIAAETGTPIFAAHSGKVRYITETSGYGKHARITDSEKETTYGHMSKFEGSNRDVKAGDIIGYVGSTGFSTGPHLHFGLKPIPQDINNGYKGSIDPMPFLKSMNQAKVVKSKTTPTVYICYPIPDMDYLQKKADLEGFEVPTVIPDSDTLK